MRPLVSVGRQATPRARPSGLARDDQVSPDPAVPPGRGLAGRDGTLHAPPLWAGDAGAAPTEGWVGATAIAKITPA